MTITLINQNLLNTGKIRGNIPNKVNLYCLSFHIPTNYIPSWTDSMPLKTTTNNLKYAVTMKRIIDCTQLHWNQWGVKYFLSYIKHNLINITSNQPSSHIIKQVENNYQPPSFKTHVSQIRHESFIIYIKY